MLNINTKNEKKIPIEVILRRNNNWYSCTNEISMLSVFIEDVDALLKKHQQLMYINASTIINTDYIDILLSNINKEYIVIKGKMYIVSKKYMPTLKQVLKDRYPSIHTHAKGSYLKKIQNKIKIDIENIKYLIRSNTQTIVFYKDGTTQCFYETLRFFDDNILEHKTFFKIRRDCIVNTKFLSNYKIDKKNKTGEIYLESETLHISRRNLQLFKKHLLISL